MAASVEADLRVVEAENHGLVDRVVVLEADKRTLQKEVDRLRKKCSHLEQGFASLATSDAHAQGELHEARARQKQLQVSVLERRIAAAEAQNDQFRCESEALSLRSQYEKLIKLHIAQTDELQQVQEELRQAKAKNAADCAELQDLKIAHEALQKQGVAHGHRNVDVFEVRAVENQMQQEIDRLTAQLSSLQSICTRQAEVIKEADVHRQRHAELEEVNRRLRLDLQESIQQVVRVEEQPFYAGLGMPLTAGGVPSLAIQTPRSPPPQLLSTLRWNTAALGQQPAFKQQVSVSSPKKRVDHSRTITPRELRSKILGARSDALEKSARLRQVFVQPDGAPKEVSIGQAGQ